jgi:hypothetical protein
VGIKACHSDSLSAIFEVGVVEKQRNEQNASWLQRFIAEVKEYIQHCFGFNDVRTRYERDRKELKRQGTDQPPKEKVSDGYETSTRWEHTKSK